jgi:hypothetical protein
MSRSSLAAEFGSVHTRVLLLDVVGGRYRVVARTQVYSTGGFPAGDVTLGLRQATARIGRWTGRKLLDDEGQIITPEDENRAGVDLFVATASGGRPLRAVLVGLMPDVSLESAVRATEGTYVDVSEIISLDETRDDEDRLNAIISTRPDLVFVTGGTEGGAANPLRKLLGVVKTAVSTMGEGARPLMLYAGNSDLADEVRALFDMTAEVLVADNVRPTLDEEDLDSAQYQLGAAFDRVKERGGSGFEKLGEMSSMGLLPTARSYSLTAEYIGTSRARGENRVIVLDVGSSAATLASHVDNEVKTTIRTDVGVGVSAPDLVNALDIDEIRRWIPYSIARADLLNYAMNKRLRPYTVPQSRLQLYIEHALLRAGVADMVKNQRPAWSNGITNADMIIAAGSTLTETGNPGMTALLLLDALQPGGAFDLFTDPSGVMTTVGALAYTAPEAVVQLMDGNSLERLGTVFAVNGLPNTRRAAVDYRIDFDDGERLEETVNGGLLVMIELPPGKTATVRVRAKGNLRLGGRRSVTREVRGGTAGIIIDTRGRPIPLAQTLKDRMIQISVWYTLASGVYHEELPEDLLEPAAERAEIAAFAEAAEPGAQPAPRRRVAAAEQQEEEVSVQELLDESEIDLDELEALFEGDEEDDIDELLR